MASSTRAAASAWPSVVAALLLVSAGCTDDTAPTETTRASVTEEPAPPPPASASAAPAPSSVPSAAPAYVAPTALPKEDVIAKDLASQRDDMLERMRVVLELDAAKLDAVRAILEKSKIIGQGNPDITAYAMTRAACRERRTAEKVFDEPQPVCGAALMVPIGKRGEDPATFSVCIDRYEFPNVPCDYPLTWASAREAAQLCQAVGKRLCDAHEWEGACAGSVLSPEEDYRFGKPRKEQKSSHNASRERVWAYGSERSLDVCAMDSSKSDTCRPSGYKKCGSNTYPAGAFPRCKSAFGVYDLHGNAAEHMNLPLTPKELGSRGGSGETEMKGSWFIFKKYDAHEDDCRWRAPDWHGTKLMSHDSHQNYHLGFRCCKDVRAPAPAP